jgi:hypothetical protein
MTSETILSGKISEMLGRPVVQRLMLLALALMSIFFLVYRLEEYPAHWYDEGSHLHVVKNFVQNGIYADYSSEGLRPFGPAVGVGPTVMLPTAVLFQLFSISIPLARMLIVAYALAALVAFYLLTGHFLNWSWRVAAFVMMFFSPGLDFIFHARTVLGEVPGAFFMLMGLWLWLRPGQRGIPMLLLIGTLFGLCAITKNQFALMVLPALLLCWFADLFGYRLRGWRHFIIPGIVSGLIFGLWTYVVIIRLGQGDSFGENFATLRAASAGAFFILSRDNIETSVRFLVDTSAYGAVILPVLVFGLMRSLRRTQDGQNYGTLMIFVLCGLALFVTSLGWPRYAFATLMLLAILVARFFFDLLRGLHVTISSVWPGLRGNTPPFEALVLLMIVGWLLVTLPMPAYTYFQRVRTQGHSDGYLMAEWLNANIPEDALIETWEQELQVLTAHRYHYPPQIVLAYSVAEVWQDGAPTSDFYDFRDYVDPDYIIRGAFEKFSPIYLEERWQDSYEIIHSIGEYDILARLPGQ